MTIYWVDTNGRLLRVTSDPKAKPEGAVEGIDVAPESGRQIWDFDNKKWGEIPPAPPSPDDDLDAAINKASTLSELKTALKGRVSARRV